MKFNWKKKKEDTPQQDNSYAGFAPISGGNNFDVYTKLEAQKQIDLANLETNYNSVTTGIKNSLTNYVKEKFTDKIVDPYFLLQMHANYFCGTIEYDCSDMKVKSAIQKVIRCAFLYGQACLWIRDKDNVGAFSVDNLEEDAFGNITSLVISNASDAINSQTNDYKPYNSFKVPKKELENIIMFRWGTMGWSAWIMVWPFVKQQHTLMKMMNTQAYTYNKKFEYKVGNQLSTTSELELFFDENSPFLITVGGADGIQNRFKTIEEHSNSARDFIAFYREFCDIWYQLFGKQSNVDYKKERNITSEVNASQDAIKTVQMDYLIQFQIFIENLKKHPSMSGIEFKFELFEQEDTQQENLENEENEQIKIESN